MNLKSLLKRTCFLSLIFILFLFTLCYPEESQKASTKGMRLWLNTLIPTLLPFIILTNIVIKMNFIDTLFWPIRRFLKIFLGLSPQGACAYFTGLLCGYPMGAKITSDLYECGKISRREAHYLLTFTNNASPAFLINYLYLFCLKKEFPLHLLLCVLFAANFICMCVFRFLIFHRHTTEPVSADMNLKKETSISSSFGTIIDVSIMNGFETITRLGGYILLFSLISAIISHYSFLPPTGQLLLSSCMELTTGLHLLSQANVSHLFQCASAIGLTASGGLCILAQTRSVVNKQLSLLPYIGAKLLNTFVSVLLVHIAFII